jgi:hypothetical protein
MHSSKLFPALCFSLTVFLTVSTVIAQEDLPWPPDPNMLFTDAVEVISVEEVDHVYGYELNSLPTCFDHSQYHENLRPTNLAAHHGRSLVIDHDAGKYFIYDEGQYVESYEFPEVLPLPGRVRDTPCRRTDGLIYITRSTSGDEAVFYPWFINEADGSIQDPERICGDHLRDLPGEGQWVTVRAVDQMKPDKTLCFTENGQLSIPVPIDYEYFHALGTSPDDQWAILSGSGSTTCDPLYSFEVATGQLIPLLVRGRTYTIGNFCSVLEWVSNEQFILYSRYQSSPTIKVLRLGNVTSPNSLEAIMNADFLGSYDEYIPERYESLIAYPTGETENVGWSCEFRRFNRTTVQLETYPLNDLCGWTMPSPGDDDVRYFRVAGQNPKLPSVLAMYNFETGERADLYTGEIEDIVGVSPDGRYVILLLDDNGRIDFIPFGDPEFDYTPIGNTSLAVYDVVSRKIAYQFNTEGFYYLTQFREELKIDWLSDDSFMISFPNMGLGGGPPHGGNKYVRFVWIAEGRHIRPNASVDYGLSPDKNLFYSIIQGTDEYPFADRQRIEVIALDTGNVRNIEAHEGAYETLVNWVDDQTLIVTVVPRPYFDYLPEEPFQSIPTAVRYTVRLVG